MATGTVKWFNTDRGYGFIQPADGSKDVFVHVTALQKAGLDNVAEGQKLNYELVTERGRSKAANIQLA